ncbi:MAG: hypothetical protein E7535_03005 [Ruminococcaceae bacterium]|nr:hypothetical protein [Oscillospiraceae bacterium]
MLYLILAILSSSLISVIMRSSSDKVKGKLTMLAANYFICSLFAAIYTRFDILPENPSLSSSVTLGTVNGILYLISFILLQFNTEKHGIVLSSIFMKLGLLVPFVLSVVLFDEIPTAVQITGFIIAVAAIIIINIKKEGSSSRFGLTLILLLLLGGSADAMSKVYEFYGPLELTNQFLFFTFITAFVLCVILVIIRKEKPSRTDILFGALIGIPNFFSSKFLILALERIPAVAAYPTFSVATILAVTITGIFIFKEKLTKLQMFALLLIIAALILLNI